MNPSRRSSVLWTGTLSYLIISAFSLAFAGISVGHPSVGMTTDSPNAVEATLPLKELRLTDSQDVEVIVPINEDIDLLDADPITLPAGAWVEVAFVTDGDITLTLPNGGGFDNFAFEVDELVWDDTLTLSSQQAYVDFVVQFDPQSGTTPVKLDLVAAP